MVIFLMLGALKENYMLWILDKRLIENDDELEKRKNYIEDVTHKRVSEWKLNEIETFGHKYEYYQCRSNNDWGIVLICHIDIVISLLRKLLNKKKAVVVIIACSTAIEKQAVYNFIKRMNDDSKLYYPKQDVVDNIQYTVQNDYGTFGFKTCDSEKCLCFYNDDGFIKAINKSFVLYQGGVNCG